MSRYIDADALKAFIRNRYFQCDMPEEWGNGVMWATSQINYYCNKEAPSIDIVRCKECKHNPWDFNRTDYTCIWDDDFADRPQTPNDFCSYGCKVSEIPTGSERSSE